MNSKYLSLMLSTTAALSIATLTLAASAQQPATAGRFHGQKTGISIPGLLTSQAKPSLPHGQKIFRPVLNNLAASDDDYNSLKMEASLQAGAGRQGSVAGEIGLLSLTGGFLYSGAGSNANQDGGYVPLDCALAVGPTTAVEPANVAISFYTKTVTVSKGVPVSANLVPYAIAQDFNTFLNYPHVLGTDPSGQTNYGYLSDPRVIYDEKTGHFVVSMIGIPYQSSNGYWHSPLLFAVSQTSDATGAWWTYQIDNNPYFTSSPTTKGYLYDYPNTGIDDNNIYVTGNVFGWTQNDYLGATLISVDKASLENGTGLRGWIFNGLSSPLTPSKVLSQGPSKASYFLFSQPYSQNSDGSGNIGLYSLVGASNTGTIPVLTKLPNIKVPYYEYPPIALGPGGIQIESLDARFQQKSLQIGDKIYATHCINDVGFPSVRAYKIDGSTQTVSQLINCWVNNTSHDFNPSIVANNSGSAAITWDYTDPNIGTRSHPLPGTQESVRVLTLSGVTAWPALAAGVLAPGSTSTKPYYAYRNGDYSCLQVDPLYQGVIWGVNQNTLDYYTPQNWLFAVKAKK